MHGKGSIPMVIIKYQQSCLKLLPHMICGYGMLFFGVSGSNNDINVLNQSSLFTSILQGSAPSTQFIVNGNQYNMGYYLADDIYSKWATFVKTIPLPYSAKHKMFATKQEAARKDVERAFRVCMLGLQYYEALLVFGVKKHLQTSCMHVLYCIT